MTKNAKIPSPAPVKKERVVVGEGMAQAVERAYAAHQQAMVSVIKQSSKIAQMTTMIINCLQNGGKVLWCGNGGSAADAQHMAAELMVRYRLDRQPLASIALTTDTSILTAHSNDYDFDTVFARQVIGLAQAGDVLVGMSTSGQSANVILAMEAAKEKACQTIALVGQADSPMDVLCDVSFHIDSAETARVQEAHNFVNHLICEGLDAVFALSK